MAAPSRSARLTEFATMVVERWTTPGLLIGHLVD